MAHEEKRDQPASHEELMVEEVGAKEERRMRARRSRNRSTWFGLGAMGMIGWSVAVPTLVGVALGYWIDSRWPSRISWTLMLLILGLALGCLNAWYWVMREQGEIDRERKEEDND